MAQVDVIVPLYNKAATIERALRSIQRQSLADWRAIVVDDGSTDQGPAIVERLADDRIVLIRQENRGPGAARNTGLRHANAEFVAFLDADDEFYPDHLANAVAALRDSDAAFAGAMYTELPKGTHMASVWARRGVFPGRHELRPDLPPEHAERLCFFFHVWNTLVRRDLVLRYDGFYEDRCRFAEDTIFFLRLAINHPFLILPTLGACYHREDSALAHTIEHPLAPFFEDPELILAYCPPQNRALVEGILARMALRTVHHLARNGHGRLAADLLGRFPRTRDWPLYRFGCRVEIALSPVLPWWVRLKRTLGPPVRRTVNNLRRRLGLLPPLPGAQKECRP